MRLFPICGFTKTNDHHHTMNEKGQLISDAAKRRKEVRSAKLELTIEGNRLFLRALGNDSVSVKMEVTPLWHFFKDAMVYKKSKVKTKHHTL